MTIHYRIDASTNRITTRVSGEVTIDEALQHFDELSADPRYEPDLDVLLDLIDCKTLPSVDDVRRAAARVIASHSPLRFRRLAIAVGALLGTLLQQSLGGQQTGTQAGTETGNPGYAAVKAPVAISNAFAIELELTSRALPGLVDGRFEFGPYQGAQASAGYRLVYTSNPSPGTPGWELLRLSSRGSSTLELHDQPLKLEDQQPHTLVWTRDTAGAMVVSVDGTQLFQVTDRSFRDPFAGFALINSGGDYALRRITIDGTQ